MYNTGVALTLIVLETSVLLAIVYSCYVRINSWINDPELPIPKLMEVFNIQWLWQRDPVTYFMVLFMLSIASIFASIVWPVTVIMGGTAATAFYLRRQKRKEKADV